MEEYYFIFAYSMNMRFNTVKDVTELQHCTCNFLGICTLEPIADRQEASNTQRTWGDVESVLLLYCEG